MKTREILDGLCELAYSLEGRHRTMQQANPLACAECECPCQFGAELLLEIPDKDFRRLLCGADCTACRQPCALCRLAVKRHLEPLPTQKETMQKSWISVAMRPYNQRHPKGGAADDPIYR